MTTERLWTTHQVATFLGLSSETVLRRWRSGELPGFRLASNCLRFDPEQIQAWLEAKAYNSKGGER